MDELAANQAAFFRSLAAQWGGGDDIFERLPATVALKRRREEGIAGWRTNLPTDYLGEDRWLEVIVPADPQSRGADLYVTPNPYLDWPHAESDGRLCLWPPGRAPVWLPIDKLAEAAINRLRWLFGLVDAAAGDDGRAEEFAREWTSYWVLRKRPDQRASGRLILIAVPSGPVALMPAIFTASGGQGKRVVVGEDLESVQRWMEQSAFTPIDVAHSSVLAVALRAAPPSPGAPQTPEEVSRFIATWAADPEAANTTCDELLADDSELPRWLVFYHGRDAFAGLQLAPRFSSLNQRRFRNDRERRHARAQRRLIGQSVAVMAVDRVDPDWIHERGRSSAANALSACHVVAVGCGSLGSQVVEGLVLSGVGTVTLVDPDRFEGANVGRHTLGVASIGEHKVDAIRQKLLADYPHLEVKAYSSTVQNANQTLSQTIIDADLVICTTADPACERYLMGRIGIGIRALLIGWTEAHALAGHSIYLRQPNVPVESLFDGPRYRFPAIRWPSEQAEALPGCGGSHLPGAGNRIRWIGTQVVEHAIDGLTMRGESSQQRCYVESSLLIDQVGGERIRPASPGPGTVLLTDAPDAFSEPES